MSGAYRHFFAIKTYSANVWNIEPCAQQFVPHYVDEGQYGFDRHPTHSLLRFLLVSNSLDLIIDIVLELWGAVVGMQSLILVKGVRLIQRQGMFPRMP